MSNSSVTLIHQPGHVFETTDFDHRWVRGSYETGIRVDDDSMSVSMAVVEFSSVLPPLSAERVRLLPRLHCGHR